MENSEISQPSVENPEDRCQDSVGADLNGSQAENTGNSGAKPRVDAARKRRAKTAKKEGRKEVSGSISVEDQACKEEYLKILRELETQHFVVPADKLEDPSKCAGAPFYCELCELKMSNVEECQNHVRTKAHKKVKKAKGEFLSLSRVPPPSEHQISALSRLLDSIFLEHGLCPVKDLPARQEVANDVGRTVSVVHADCTVSLYGSSFTGFGLKDSDVNLDLVIPEEANVPHILLSILELLQKDDNYCDVKSEFDAKVPLILFKHASSGLDCELSPGNVNASKTSLLLKKYSDLDQCVRCLTVGLRYWARLCSVDCQSEGGLPGYSLALMVIQFLQEIKPPVLPRWTPSEVIDKDDLCTPQEFVNRNKDETGRLWVQLFRFYCVDFDMPNLVISIKEPLPLKRQAKKWGFRRIAVEDPFSCKRNVASSLSSDRVFEYFFTCWKNSYLYFASIPSDTHKKPLTEAPNNNRNTSAKKNISKGTMANKQEAKLANNEEGIFEMDDLDHTTKQMQRMELSGVDSVQTKSGSPGQTGGDLSSLKSQGDSDTEIEIEITLSESEGEDTSEPGAQAGSSETGSLGKGGHSTAVLEVLDVVYRFDAQIFRGNNRPVKTCCYCKEDGHVKEQCPDLRDLRKPALRKLPPMTVQFAAVLDYVCKNCRADFEFDRTEVAYREKVLKNLEDYIHGIFPEARLFLFGSSKNGFGFRNSDIDICMTLENHTKEEVDPVDVITQLAKLLRKHKDCGSVIAITTAKVPIVKFYLRSCQREADISLYNTLALENTAMLATYAQLDDRVATLGYTVKVFAKVCDIGDASKGSLSSYAYILMLLHYLQQCNPPVIPLLQSLYTDNKQPEKIIDGWNCWFCSDLEKIKSLWKPKERNTMSAGLLWYGFLRYYTEEFDFEHDVVCCRRVKKLTKFEKMWTKHVFAIEDPFNLDHNLGAGVTRKMAYYIQTALIKGRERFGFPRYDISAAIAQRFFFDVYFLTDGYEAPTDRNCRICSKIGHIAKDCPLSKSNRRAELKKEEEERKINQGETGDFTKPFSTGPSRSRAASAPSKQGQNKGSDNRTPVPTAQPTKIPSRQEASVTSVSKSQPESQFITSNLKEGQNDDNINDSSVNSCGMHASEVSQTPSLVRNLETSLANADTASGQQGKVRVDPNETHTRVTAANVSSPIIAHEIGGNPTAMHSPRSSVSGNQSNVTPTTIPSSSTAPPAHAQSTPPSNPSPIINPPPGFYIPDFTRQAPHGSLPQIIAGSMSPIAARFQGQAISPNTPPLQHPTMFSGHFVGSPGSPEMWLRYQAMMMRDPHSLPVRPLVPYPLTPEFQAQAQFHQPRGPSENLPIQHSGSPVHGQQFSEHSHQMIPQSPPNVSRNLMWPVGGISPPPVVRGQQFQDQLPTPLVSSPGMQGPAVGSPQHIIHPQLSHHANSPGVTVAHGGSPQNVTHGNPHKIAGSPQQIPQQFQFPHSPGMPTTPGSPPQHMPQQPIPHQLGLAQHVFGAHMTGEQFINLMRVAEEESMKLENALHTASPSDIPSDDFEPDELEHIAPKGLKVAKTPEEHQLLSKLSKVKSLWEGGSSPGLESNPNPLSVDTRHVTTKDASVVVHSSPNAKLTVKREAWGNVSEKDAGNGESKNVCVVREEKEEIDSGTPNSVSSSIEGESGVSLEAPHEKDGPSSARPVDAEEKLHSKSSDKDGHQKSLNPTQPTPAVAEAHQEVLKQKPTRRGGRRRKPKAKGSRNESTPEMSEEKSPGGRANKVKADRQRSAKKNYDDLKESTTTASPSSKKPRREQSERCQGETQNPGHDTESRPRQGPKQKELPVSGKERDTKGPEGNKQGGKGMDKKVPEGSKHGGREIGKKIPEGTKQGAKEIDRKGYEGNKQGGKETEQKVPKGNKQGGKEIDYKVPDGNKQGGKEIDYKVPDGSKQGGKEIGKKVPEGNKRGTKEIGKGEPEGNKQGAGTRDPDRSPEDSSKGGRGGTPNRGRRPPRSRTKSGASVGEKDDARKLTSSMPEKRPSKDS